LSKDPVNDSSLGICSIEKDFGMMTAASFINRSAFDPLNAQQFPG